MGKKDCRLFQLHKKLYCNYLCSSSAAILQQSGSKTGWPLVTAAWKWVLLCVKWKMQHCCVLADSVLPPSGCSEEVPDGAQEQRGKFGEVPGRAEETAPEEPGQQAPLQIWRQGDAGLCVFIKVNVPSDGSFRGFEECIFWSCFYGSRRNETDVSALWLSEVPYGQLEDRCIKRPDKHGHNSQCQENIIIVSPALYEVQTICQSASRENINFS